MLTNFSSKSLSKKIRERPSNSRIYIKSEEKLIEDEIEEMLEIKQIPDNKLIFAKGNYLTV